MRERELIEPWPNVFVAPEEWQPNESNPETGLPFSADWRGIYLENKADEEFANGTSASGLFGIRFHRKVPNVDRRVRDFILYETSNGSNIIVGSDYEVDLEKLIAEMMSAPVSKGAIRSDDARYVVHSTPLENWKSICTDMKLKSPNELRREGKKCDAPGQELLGDPTGYLDYIHFSPYQTMHTELVILTRQRGKMCLDEHAEYVPGVRIYLDHHAMLQDGLVVRDGLHYSKVRNSLDLSKYMVLSVNGGHRRQGWTPRKFTQYATRRFEEHLEKTSYEQMLEPKV